MARVWRARWVKGPMSGLRQLKPLLAGHRLETASLQRPDIGTRKPFKAVARVQIPLGPRNVARPDRPTLRAAPATLSGVAFTPSLVKRL